MTCYSYSRAVSGPFSFLSGLTGHCLRLSTPDQWWAFGSQAPDCWEGWSPCSFSIPIQCGLIQRPAIVSFSLPKVQCCFCSIPPPTLNTVPEPEKPGGYFIRTLCPASYLPLHRSSSTEQRSSSTAGKEFVCGFPYSYSVCAWANLANSEPMNTFCEILLFSLFHSQTTSLV